MILLTIRPVSHEAQGQQEDEDDDGGSHLNEEPGGDQGQTAVLTVEAVVICIEGKVVQIEEPEEHKQIHVQTHDIQIIILWILSNLRYFNGILN